MSSAAELVRIVDGAVPERVYGFAGDGSAGRVAEQDAAEVRVSFTKPETEASSLTYIAWAALESESRVHVA